MSLQQPFDEDKLRMSVCMDSPPDLPQLEASRIITHSMDSTQKEDGKNKTQQPFEHIRLEYMLRISVSSDWQREAAKIITHESNNETPSHGKDVCKDAQHVIEIFREKLQEPSRWPERCIYKVPKKLRKVNDVAYTPKLISIGPLHYGVKELQDMKIHKLRYFRDFCHNRSNHRSEEYFKQLAEIVEKNEEKIRHCYEETYEQNIDSKEYVSMILLDAIFIIELFIRNRNTFEKFDYILSTPWLANGIMQDLILLENQLPLFILNKLFKTCSYLCTDASFLELACYYFHSHSQIPQHEKEVKHFTDLERYFLCPPNLKRAKKGCDKYYSATKLDDAGVKFKAVTGRHLLHIEFLKSKWLDKCPWLNCSGISNCLPFLKKYLEGMQPLLTLRPIEVYDDFESRYRNLMAFEQCHYPCETYVCNYILLLDHLIDTDKDVDFLVDKGIIVNEIGSNSKLAKVVNKLCLEIGSTNSSCYDDTYLRLHEHCSGAWSRVIATLTSVYFKDFWRGSGTIAALIVLCITIWNFIKPFVL